MLPRGEARPHGVRASGGREAGAWGPGGGQAVAPGTLQPAEGSRGETLRPADKWQRCKGALGANGEAEPSGGAGPPPSPNTGRAPPLRAACPLGLMWE